MKEKILEIQIWVKKSQVIKKRVKQLSFIMGKRLKKVKMTLKKVAVDYAGFAFLCVNNQETL